MDDLPRPADLIDRCPEPAPPRANVVPVLALLLVLGLALALGLWLESRWPLHG